MFKLKHNVFTVHIENVLLHCSPGYSLSSLSFVTIYNVVHVSPNIYLLSASFTYQLENHLN